MVGRERRITSNQEADWSVDQGGQKGIKRAWTVRGNPSRYVRVSGRIGKRAMSQDVTGLDQVRRKKRKEKDLMVPGSVHSRPVTSLRAYRHDLSHSSAFSLEELTRV
jgi:hypothetical protein